MAAEHSAVHVQLIDDHVFERFEQLRPLCVVREDGRMQHVRVREHDMPGRANRPPRVRRCVAIVSKRTYVRASFRNQAVQLVELVLGERLGWEQVERPRRAVLEDCANHRDVVAECLATRCRGHDDCVLARERTFDGLRLVCVRPLNAALSERFDELRVHAVRPLGEPRPLRFDPPHNDIRRLRLQLRDHARSHERHGKRPYSRERCGRRGLGHSANPNRRSTNYPAASRERQLLRSHRDSVARMIGQRRQVRRRRDAMSDHVYKVIELVGSSKDSVEDAVQGAISRASETIQGLDWFAIKEVRGNIQDGKVGWYQVTLSVGFQVKSPEDMKKGE